MGADPQYKHTKLFYSQPNKQKSKHVVKMGSHKLSTWIKSITGYNNLAYFQSNKTLRSIQHCLNSNETIHHLMKDWEVK